MFLKKTNSVHNFLFFFQWKDIFILTKTASDTVLWSARRGNLAEPTVLLWFISLKYYTHVLQARSSSEHHVLYISSAYDHLYMYTSVCTYDHNLVLLLLYTVSTVVNTLYVSTFLLESHHAMLFSNWQRWNCEFIFFFYQNIY